jgi:hypothetical protein
MTCPLHHGIRQPYLKWVPQLSWGLPKLRVQRQNPPSQVRAAQSNQGEGQSNTKGDQQLAQLVPHRGGLVSSSFISESQPRGFLHAPSSRLALSCPGFSLGLPVVQPLRVHETLDDGVGLNFAPHSDNMDEIMGLH